MRFFTKNPATGQEIQEYIIEDRDCVMARVDRAHDQFQCWKSVDAYKRAILIKSIATELEKKCEFLASIITSEMGKSISEARAEIQKCANLCRYYAENAPRWLQDEKVVADGEEHLILYEPLGVVLTIMPWNFPFWQALRFAIPAIAAGNVVLLKHSNVVAGCALAIENLFEEAGFSPNIFQTVITDHSVTEDLIKDLRVMGVSFTGSTSVGQKIGSLAGGELKKVVLELGGADPFIVFEDADIEQAAIAATTGRLINAGQSCIAAKRFIVVKEVADQFIKLFVEHMSSKTVGDPLDEKIDLGPMVNEKGVLEIESQLRDALEKGAKLLCGGKRVSGTCFLPTVITNVDSTMRVIREEVFGPIAPVIIVKDEKEAIMVANSTEFGLGASLWSKDSVRARRVATEIDAGTVFINSIVKSDPRMPFGGVKRSGVGRELSRFGLYEFLNIKGYNQY